MPRFLGSQERIHRAVWAGLLTALAAASLLSCDLGTTSSPAQTPAPVSVASPTPSPTPASTPTPLPSSTPTETPFPTRTPTLSATPTPTLTKTSTATPSAIPTVASFSLRAFTNGRWLEQNRPTLASAITSLVWVADGIDDAEQQAVQGLVDIEASVGLDSYPALTDKPWVRDGVDELESSVILRIRELVVRNESDGQLLVGLAFLDTHGQVDAGAVELLAGIAADQPDLFRTTVDKPWVADGLGEHEILVVEGLLALTESSEEAALLILSMPFLETVEDVDVPQVGALGALASRDSDVFNAVVGRTWLDDGLDEAETLLLQKLGAIADQNRSPDFWIATFAAPQGSNPFIEDNLLDQYDIDESGTIDHAEVLLAVTDFSYADITEDESMYIVTLYAFSEAFIQTPPLMELVEATSWYRDGITDFTADPSYTEWRALEALQRIDNNNSELAKTILAWSWIFDEQLVINETSILEYMRFLDENAPELARLLLRFPWLADNIDRWETSAVGRLYELVYWNQPDFAMELAASPWVTDGVTFLEVLFGINTLKDIAISPDTDSADPQMARKILGLIKYPPGVLDLSLIQSLGNLREHPSFSVQTGLETHNPDRLNRLFMEPWIADGLDRKERVYLIAAITSEEDRLGDPYTIETKAIELPLAGPVNLWVVGYHQFSPQNTLATMERAVRGSEEFWSIPFPVENVILYVLEPGTRGRHIGIIMFLDSFRGNVEASTMFHETAHYYCNAGPAWFNEGCAHVIRDFINNDGNIPTTEFPDYCAENGLQTLQDLNDLGGGPLWDTCKYAMGQHFLLRLRDVMGEEAWLSALRAYFLEYVPEGLYVTTSDSPEDEDIYHLVLEHTPPVLVEEVKGVFKRLHGGPFISQEG